MSSHSSPFLLPLLRFEQKMPLNVSGIIFVVDLNYRDTCAKLLGYVHDLYCSADDFFGIPSVRAVSYLSHTYRHPLLSAEKRACRENSTGSLLKHLYLAHPIRTGNLSPAVADRLVNLLRQFPFLEQCGILPPTVGICRTHDGRRYARRAQGEP